MKSFLCHRIYYTVNLDLPKTVGTGLSRNVCVLTDYDLITVILRCYK